MLTYVKIFREKSFGSSLKPSALVKLHEPGAEMDDSNSDLEQKSSETSSGVKVIGLH